MHDKNANFVFLKHETGEWQIERGLSFVFFLFLGRMASYSSESTDYFFGVSVSASKFPAAPGDSASSRVTCSNYGWVYPEVKCYPSWYESQDEGRLVVLP